MRMRRMLAFLLMLAMLMGNVTPAFAAENVTSNTVSGNVQITTDENGNTVVTPISDETKEPEEGEEGTVSGNVGQEPVIEIEPETEIGEEDSVSENEVIVPEDEVIVLEGEVTVSENALTVSENSVAMVNGEDAIVVRCEGEEEEKNS